MGWLGGGARLLASQNAVEAEMLRPGLEQWRDGPPGHERGALLSSQDPRAKSSSAGVRWHWKPGLRGAGGGVPW